MFHIRQLILFVGHNLKNETSAKRVLAHAFRLAASSGSTMLVADEARRLFQDDNVANSFLLLCGSNVNYLRAIMNKELPAREFFAAFFSGSPLEQVIFERTRDSKLTWQELGPAVATHFNSLGIEWEEEWLYLIADTRFSFD